MFRPTFSSDRSRHAARRGLSLVEMLMATAICAIVLMGFAAMAETLVAVDNSSSGEMSSLQHGQVALMRIQDHVRLAYVTESFPGFRVHSTTVGTQTYPDLLIIWRPTGTPANPTGKPRVNELVVIGPDPNTPNNLIELRHSSSTTTCPNYSDNAGWTTTLTNMFTSGQKTTLTGKLRTAIPADSTSTRRGCLRFLRLAEPTDAEFSSYRASTIAWSALDWPLDLNSTKAGVRTVTCLFELQLATSDANSINEMIPLFGSASRSYEVLP
jgi:prepilin-type N-terminal cleavage/methylation domain-containing protein